jgi:hypothetical protein
MLLSCTFVPSLKKILACGPQEGAGSAGVVSAEALWFPQRR